MSWLRFTRRVWVFALALAALTSAPYALGALRAAPGWTYSGAPAVPVGTQVDFNSHLAKMWQGSRGQFAYRLLFTHEAHPGIIGVQGFYVALGAMTWLTPFSLPLVYHLARFAATAAMILAVWAFAARYFERDRERWLALVFATLVGGWSWLLLFIDPALTSSTSPIEFWLTDAFNLLGAFYMPHFAAAVVLQITALLALEDWVRSGRPAHLIHLTLALAASAIVQPYGVLLFGPLIVLLAAQHIYPARRLNVRRALALTFPLGVYGALTLYQYLTISADPVWAQFSGQNQTLSPLVTYYLLGYLPLLIPVILGARRFMLESADDRWWVPILWLALVAVLLYAPFPTQRRYLLGAQTPLAVLAAYGWSRVIWPRLKPWRRGLLTSVYVALASIALVGMWAANLGALAAGQGSAAFYTPDETQAYAWLRTQNQPDALVLTTFNTDGEGSGGRLVAATGQRVFIGHWYETADFSAKLAELARFYEPSTPDSWRRSWLGEIGAVYIWYDDYARTIGAWDPAGADFLTTAFSAGDLTIYRVTP